MIIESNKKSLKENRLDKEDFDDLVKFLCLDTGFEETSPNHYRLKEIEDEIGAMVVLRIKFEKMDYVSPYLKKWITYDEDDGRVDMLKQLKIFYEKNYGIDIMQCNMEE